VSSLAVSKLDSGSSCPGLSNCRGHCIEVLGKIINLNDTVLHSTPIGINVKNKHVILGK